MGLILQPAAPAVHVPRKTYADERILRETVRMMRRVPRPLPVIYANRHIAWAMGCSCCDRVHVTTERKWLSPLTSYDDIIAEMTASAPKVLHQMFSKNRSSSLVSAAYWYDLWAVRGDPEGGAYGGTAYTATQKNSSTAGAIAIGPDVSTDTRHLSHVWAVCQNSVGGPPSLLLYDRVLTYETCSFNAATPQSFTNSVAAQRYISSGEPGLLVMLTNDATLGSTSSNLTGLTYVDNEGNTGQTMPTTTTVSITATVTGPGSTLGARVVAPGDMWGFSLPLANGDTGVRSLTDFTTSAVNTGTLCFVLMQPIACIPQDAASTPSDLDYVRQLLSLDRIYDGACLSLVELVNESTTSCIVQGGFTLVWG